MALQAALEGIQRLGGLSLQEPMRGCLGPPGFS